MNYSIGDFVIQIKNASLARRREVTVPFSGLTNAVGKVLKKEGFLEGIQEEVVDGKKVLIAKLRYVQRKPTVTGVKVISKPSLRSYIGAKDVGKKRSSAVKIVSTNVGIITGKEANTRKVGGELLFEIW